MPWPALAGGEVVSFHQAGDMNDDEGRGLERVVLLVRSKVADSVKVLMGHADRLPEDDTGTQVRGGQTPETAKIWGFGQREPAEGAKDG